MSIQATSSPRSGGLQNAEHSGTKKNAGKWIAYGALSWAGKATVCAVPTALKAAGITILSATATGALTGAGVGATGYATYKVANNYLKDR